MRRRLAFLFAAAAVFWSAPQSSAGDINWTKIREVSRAGPTTIELKDGVTVRVPTQYRFVTEEKLKEYHELMGDVPLPDEAGYLLPETGGWVVAVLFPKADPMKDQDPKQLNPDALMGWNEKALDDGQPKRTTVGLPTLRATGWTHKPAYDEAAKKLTMGVRVTPADDRNSGKKDELYYKTVLYGPDGKFVALQTMTAFTNWTDPLEETKKLAGEFSFKGNEAVVEEEDPMYYAKIGGAGLIGMVAVIFGAKLLGGNRRPEPGAGRGQGPARRFGTPR